MSTQPKTIGSGLSLSNVRTQVDMLEAWLESLPTPAMIEVRATVKNILGSGTHEVWHLVRIEEADVTDDNPEGRVYRITHSTDEPSAGDPTADLTTSHAVARYLKASSSVTVLVPEPSAAAEPEFETDRVHRIEGLVRAWVHKHRLTVSESSVHILADRIAAEPSL